MPHGVHVVSGGLSPFSAHVCPMPHLAFMRSGHTRDRGMGPWGGRIRGGAGGRAGHCALRRGVTRKTDREGGRNDKTFDHSEIVPC
jgi:hypothetical protein